MMIGDTETEVGDHSRVPGEQAGPQADKIQLFNRCVSAGSAPLTVLSNLECRLRARILNIRRAKR